MPDTTDEVIDRLEREAIEIRRLLDARTAKRPLIIERVATVKAFLTVGSCRVYEPTVNSKDELTVATSLRLWDVNKVWKSRSPSADGLRYQASSHHGGSATTVGFVRVRGSRLIQAANQRLHAHG